MHLTFINSEGLEQSALSFLAAAESEPQPNLNCSKKMAVENYDDSECDDNEFLVIDENSPLLLDLDPPGTRANYMNASSHTTGKRENTRSYLSFKIRGPKSDRLPWIIVFTSLGMAAMVFIGFMTMFQKSEPIDRPSTDIISNNFEAGKEVNVQPPQFPSPPAIIEPNLDVVQLQQSSKVNEISTVRSDGSVKPLNSLGKTTNST